MFPQHNRKALWLFGSHDVVYPARVQIENLTVQKEERVECLVLGRGTDVALNGQRGQKLSNLFFSQLCGVACPVEEDEPIFGNAPAPTAQEEPVAVG